MESNGFDFAALVNRVPHLEQELMTFRDHLLASASQEQTLKVRLKIVAMLQSLLIASEPCLRAAPVSQAQEISRLSAASHQEEETCRTTRLPCLSLHTPHRGLSSGQHLLAATELQVWDLKDLGVQAAQRISQAADPLKLLADISQSFPTLVSSLSKLPVNESLAGEVRANQQQIPSGDPCTGISL